MVLKNLNKDLLGNIVIIVSFILVIICIGMIISMEPINQQNTSFAEWDGMNYIISPDSEYSVSYDSLIVTSSFEGHNIELKKTKDLSVYDTNIRNPIEDVEVSSFNSTHDLYVNRKLSYGAIIPKEAVDGSNNDPYKLMDNTEIIEVICSNPDYINSFLGSATEG